MARMTKAWKLWVFYSANVAFRHTRLSVIDLSATGHQPMSSADNSISIVFNGGVYSYSELHFELEVLGYNF